mgnify:FL=1
MQSSKTFEKTQATQRKADRQVYAANDEFGYKQKNRRKRNSARNAKRS